MVFTEVSVSPLMRVNFFNSENDLSYITIEEPVDANTSAWLIARQSADL
jgi:hypothetical protein